MSLQELLKLWNGYSVHWATF